MVRWFILADGLTYGSNKDVPTKGALRPRLSGTRWRFNPPALSQRFQSDFRVLLEAFARANHKAPQRPIKLLPVLIDYLFCRDGNVECRDASNNPTWVSRGRADVVIDKRKRSKFFDNVLDPLLKISNDYSNLIFAWEIINEPEWVTVGWNPTWPQFLQRYKDITYLTVDQTDMAMFLQEGIRRVRASDFDATVGFATINTINTICKDTALAAKLCAGLNQFHHYPGTVEPETLPSLNSLKKVLPTLMPTGPGAPPRPLLVRSVRSIQTCLLGNCPPCLIETSGKI